MTQKCHFCEFIADLLDVIAHERAVHFIRFHFIKDEYKRVL